MSGGSLDYLYMKVEEAACSVRERGGTPLHRAFADHLDKIAKALHDIEWVLSYDYGEGDDVEAIRACLPEGAEMSRLIEEAHAARAALDAALHRNAATAWDALADAEPKP